MTIKEKTENILGGFLERNKDYAIHAYIKNGVTGNIIIRLLITTDRIVKPEKEKYLIEWSTKAVQGSSFSLLYDEIMDCYGDRDEYNIQTVVVILKNGMKVEFECVGDRV